MTTPKQQTLEPEQQPEQTQAQEPEGGDDDQSATDLPVIYGATPEMLQALHSDTPPEAIHYRQAVGRGGQPVLKDGQPLMLAYVTARYVQDRLDQVLGPQNWQNAYEGMLSTGAVRCGIGVLISGENGSAWHWKFDVGVPSNIEPEKGAHSDAFKRAAVLWGVGRDLYDERDEDEPQPVAVGGSVAPAPGATIQQQMGDASVARPVITEASAPMQQQQQPALGWLCPIHNDAKIVPAGVSKRTGRPYPAFLACPVAGCDQKPPRA